MAFPTKRKNILSAVVTGVMTLGLLVGVVLVQQNQNISKQASGLGCKDFTKVSECNKSCTDPKGKKNISYQCRWSSKDSKCIESSKECVTTLVNGSIISGLVNCSSLSSTYCTVPPQIPGSVACISVNQEMAYCCPANTHLEGTYGSRECVPD